MTMKLVSVHSLNIDKLKLRSQVRIEYSEQLENSEGWCEA